MNCENIILEVLKEAGDTGLPVSKITHHVYNASNSLFHDIAWDDVKSYVSTFLLKQSRNPNSLIEKTEKRLRDGNCSTKSASILAMRP